MPFRPHPSIVVCRWRIPRMDQSRRWYHVSYRNCGVLRNYSYFRLRSGL